MKTWVSIGAIVLVAINTGGCNRRRSYYDETARPLGEAAYRSDLAGVKKAIEDDGIDPNANGPISGGRAIHIAAERGNTEIVSYLLSKGADPNLRGGNFDETALVAAARAGYPTTVKRLLDSKKVTIEDQSGRSALIEAKTFQVVQVLVEAGADLTYTDRWRQGALTSAINRRDVRTVQFLIDKGAPVKSSASYMTMAASVGNVEFLEVLKREGGDVNETRPPYFRRDEAFSPIHAAIKFPAALDWLIKNGANVDQPTNFRNTALHLACGKSLPEAVAMLLKGGASLNAHDSIGRTPLHLLISGGGSDFEEAKGQTKALLKCLELLHRHGANLNAVDANGWSPIFRAATKGEDDLAILLVNLGADPKLRDVKGRTAGDLARQFGHVRLAQKLESGQ